MPDAATVTRSSRLVELFQPAASGDGHDHGRCARHGRHGSARHGEGGAPMELTVAFTDLEDFTSYTEAEGDDTASRLLIGHHRESAAIVRARGGRVLKRLGDGLMLTFPEPEAAVLACLELGEAAPLRLRAGIHGGHVMVTSDDVFGHVVNLAARVTSPPQAVSWSSPTTYEPQSATSSASRSTAQYQRSFKGIEEEVSVYVATVVLVDRATSDAS